MELSLRPGRPGMSFPEFDLSVLGGADPTSLGLIDGLLQHLYPSWSTPPLNFRDAVVIAIAFAPETEFDLWDAIGEQSGHRPQDNAWLDQIVLGAFRYYQGRLRDDLTLRVPVGHERAVLEDLALTVQTAGDDLETLTAAVYDCGKRHYAQAELRQFFQLVYECLLGQADGPRLPNYVLMIGRERFLALVSRALTQTATAA